MKTIMCVVAVAAACARPTAETTLDLETDPCSTSQIFGNAQHSGTQTCSGVSAMSVRARLTTDPDAQRQHDDRGYYSVQVGAALTDGPSVYVPAHRGYTGLFTAGDETWSVQGWRWIDGALAPLWTHDTTWSSVDSLSVSYTNLNEQLFQPVLANSSLYVPGRSGTVERVDPATGRLVALVDPLAGTPFSGDPDVFVMGALSADVTGAVWYTAAALNRSAGVPARGAWLVRVLPDDTSTAAPWTSVAARSVGVPQPDDLCQYSFDQAGLGQRPLPPSPSAATPLFRCGGQRPPVNAAPAVTANGRTVYVVSSDNNAVTHIYLIAVDAKTLQPLRASPFQGHLHDGCGVLVPYGVGPSDCRRFTPLGNDPEFNAPETITYAGPIANSPVIAPDGGLYFGGIGFDGYDDFRGHMYRFDQAGNFLGAYPYAFAATPLIYRHGGTFTLAFDDSSTSDGTDPSGVFRMSRFAPDFTHESTFTAQSDPDAEANDLLDGQGVIDRLGNFYSLGASGVVRKLSPTGALLETLKLDSGGEAQASPLSWGSDDQGRPVLYAPLFGALWVIGQG